MALAEHLGRLIAQRLVARELPPRPPPRAVKAKEVKAKKPRPPVARPRRAKVAAAPPEISAGALVSYREGRRELQASVLSEDFNSQELILLDLKTQKVLRRKVSQIQAFPGATAVEAKAQREPTVEPPLPEPSAAPPPPPAAKPVSEPTAVQTAPAAAEAPAEPTDLAPPLSQTQS